MASKNIIFYFLSMLLLANSSIAQHIGINNTAPRTSLDVNGGMAIAIDTVPILTQPYTILDITNKSAIAVSSNNTDATSRIINLSPGVGGQQLSIFYNAGTLNGRFALINGSKISNGGSLLLSTNWTPINGAAITLLCNGKNWIETGRFAGETAWTDSVILTASSNTLNLKNYQVPGGYTKLVVYVWGGGGGIEAGLTAGSGGFVSGEVNVNPGDSINIMVGHGGLANSFSGTGGMHSLVRINGTLIAIAGGGGNPGGNGNGGNAGNSGTAGTGNSNGGGPGGGATQIINGVGGTAGASGSNGENGSLLSATNYTSYTGGTNNTGTNSVPNGYGGSGYRGGGGGGTYLNFPTERASAGGGGGANYVAGLNLVLNNTVATNSASTSSTAYAACGAQANGNIHGRVAIVFK